MSPNTTLGRIRTQSRLRIWQTLALLMSSGRTHAKGNLALRFQGQVIHTLGLFLKEKQKGSIGNTSKRCLNPLQKALPCSPGAGMREASMAAPLCARSARPVQA